MTLTAELKQAAAELGFTLAGVCPAVTPQGIHRFFDWLRLGYAGSMNYLESRAAAYEHPRHVLAGVRSLLLLGLNYHSAGSFPSGTDAGRISQYAWGSRDYHDVIHPRLKQLVALIQQRQPGSQARGVVDSAPLFEREFAQLAGLGWIGKHTLLINPRQGSWFFLAAVLTDVVLDYDEPFGTDHCGTCRACLDACPTQAFPAPYVLDARRCLSYLTIELRAPIPAELRSPLADWVFGCDICQQVCPWNRRAPETQEPEFLPRADLIQLDLPKLFELSDEQFRHLYRQTPLWRAKRRGLLRNAAIALGNQGSSASLAALERGLQDTEPVVRGACVWAIGQIHDNRAGEILRQHSTRETDPDVLQELRTARTSR